MRAAALILCCYALTFASYRPFDIVLTGSRAAGIGGAGTTLLAAPESIVYNPASLSRVTWSEFFYEAYAALRIQRITAYNFDVRYDYTGFIGMTIPLKDTTWTFAVSQVTLFSGESSISVRELGLTAAVSLPSIAAGITAGPVVAYDNGSFSISGVVQAGVLANPLPPLLIGASFSSPIPLHWTAYRGASVVDELLPYTVRLGGSWFITGDIGLYGDVEFQGWHAAYYRADGASSNRIDNPADAFSFARTLHPHIGIELYDRTAIANNLGGGVWRFGFFTRSTFTPSGLIDSQYVLSFGTTVFAGKYIRFSVSFLDSWLLGQLVNPSATAIEEGRITIEIDLSILSAKA